MTRPIGEETLLYIVLHLGLKSFGVCPRNRRLFGAAVENLSLSAFFNCMIIL